jgi:hypothetical protein
MKYLAIFIAASLLAIPVAQASPLSAREIVEKNIAARGGINSLRSTQSMVWVGHIRSANGPVAELPFILEMKRTVNRQPGNKQSQIKTRFEIKAQSLASLRVYDGSRGWKWHINSSGRPETQAYTAEELRFERDGPGLEMPFSNPDALDVALEGTDQVEGRRAYRISEHMPSGAIRHVWIDAENFLIVKSDREARNTLGQTGVVVMAYRDYRLVDGLQLPFTIESGAGSGKATDKMVIDRIVLNPRLDDMQFAQPAVSSGNGRMVVRAERGK